jgi:hypothetical protein
MTLRQVVRAEIVSRFMDLRLFESKFDESLMDLPRKSPAEERPGGISLLVERQ